MKSIAIGAVERGTATYSTGDGTSSARVDGGKSGADQVTNSATGDIAENVAGNGEDIAVGGAIGDFVHDTTGELFVNTAQDGTENSGSAVGFSFKRRGN